MFFLNVRTRAKDVDLQEGARRVFPWLVIRQMMSSSAERASVHTRTSQKSVQVLVRFGVFGNGAFLKVHLYLIEQDNYHERSIDGFRSRLTRLGCR